MIRRAAVVVLHEVGIQSDVAEHVAVPGLKEEAAGVAEDLRFKQPRIVDFGRDFFMEEGSLGRGEMSEKVSRCRSPVVSCRRSDKKQL